ncbi:hypothetical protein NA56DRAFT_651988 [Hyaloscypha hepaticicola]|uniref:Uncharacterized protein n=1 Tax=Hyaloscypha hepaticicola TaxID=2082293 RepID=A0A2J6PGP2_9HELO|nr:hypothetical protein NA56DRAFT_651988 [Hyaloscypha hepaticicola]
MSPVTASPLRDSVVLRNALRSPYSLRECNTSIDVHDSTSCPPETLRTCRYSHRSEAFAGSPSTIITVRVHERTVRYTSIELTLRRAHESPATT